jgi:hypothetical protein
MSKQCFMISPMGPAGSDRRRRTDNVLRFIVRPVCEELGFTTQRADEMSHSSLITRKVMEQILTADLVVADLTGGNPNVYYELAVRHFVGKPVVHLIAAGEHLPFDLNDINTIHVDHTDLESADVAKRQLRNCILADGAAGAVPNPISAVLESLAIRVRRERDSKTLAEAFEAFSAIVLDELKSSKQQQEVLWAKLFPSEPHEGCTETGGQPFRSLRGMDFQYRHSAVGSGSRSTDWAV